MWEDKLTLFCQEQQKKKNITEWQLLYTVFTDNVYFYSRSFRLCRNYKEHLSEQLVFVLALELVTFPIFFLLCGTCSNGSAKTLSSKLSMYDNHEWCKKLTQHFVSPASEYKQKEVMFDEIFLFVCESTAYNV